MTTYSVTYDGNGSDDGMPPTDSNSYQADETVTVSGNTGTLTLTGYSFGGWNTAANGSGSAYAAGDTFTISADTILYAQWIPDYATWIAGYSVGTETAAADDPDKDGIANIVENYLGTDPSVPTQALAAQSVDSGAGTFTFTHPINATPAGDTTAVYRWSKDLSTFHNDGSTDADGTTLTVSQGSVSNGTVTVTATLSGTATDRVFIRIEVTQN